MKEANDAGAARVPVLAGATASGKSSLALELAERFSIEVVSADAMMVYTYMDIGTAKPSAEERARVPHHLIDLIEPDAPFSVAQYVQHAERTIAEVLARGNVPLVVGGTGFYIRALTGGLPTTPRADERVQAPLWQRFKTEGLEGLERELAALSPQDAARAERNPRRVIRALEVWQRTGRSPQSFPYSPPRFSYSKRVLSLPLAEHEAAITERTEAMFRAGLIDEVRALCARYPSPPTAFQAIGYKEVREGLAAGQSEDALRCAVRRATLRYAKRQRTWFNREPHIAPLERPGAAAWLAALV